MAAALSRHARHMRRSSRLEAAFYTEAQERASPNARPAVRRHHGGLLKEGVSRRHRSVRALWHSTPRGTLPAEAPYTKWREEGEATRTP